MTEKKKLVIVGGGGAGLFVGATVLHLSKKFDVYLISDEDLYCRCSSPYILNKRAELKHAIMPDEMITNFNINLVKGRAKNINKKEKFVVYSDLKGEDRVCFYDVLVFATGARSFIPPIEGVDLKGVFKVRDSEDVRRIDLKIKKSKSAVVVGGGVIGVEMASALRQRGLDVSLLILEDRPFSNLADEEFQKLIENNLVKNKVNVIGNSQIKRVIGSGGAVSGVEYGMDGDVKKKKADLVIFATGVRPNLELAQGMGVKCEKRGIVVNDRFETSKKGVYAVGDVVVSKCAITGKNKPSQLATNAVIQGKIAGKNIAGMKTKYGGHTSAMMLEFLEEEFGSCGLTEGMCKAEGIDYYTGFSHTTDIYQDLNGAHQVAVKLVFNKKNNRVIGVQGYGRNLIWIVNLISFAIQKKSTVFDLMNLDYASHPSVSPWPFMDPIVDACEHALENLQK